MRIFHISDLHIRGVHHASYLHAFSKLRSAIKESLGTQIVLAITGDIFMYKDTLSPSDAAFFADFLDEFAAMLPVVIILGNHDCVVSARYDCIMSSSLRVGTTASPEERALASEPRPDIKCAPLRELEHDLVSPILKFLKHAANVRLVRTAEEFAGATWVNLAWGGAASFDRAANSVGLFHGQKIPPCASAYQCVLVGDYHEPQMFSSRIGACGALIQNNISEKPRRGYLCWTIGNGKDMSAQFHSFGCPYGFIKLVLADNKIVYDGTADITDPQNICINHQRCAIEFVQKVALEMKLKYPKIEPLIVNVEKFTAELCDDEALLNEYIRGHDESTITNILKYHASIKNVDAPVKCRWSITKIYICGYLGFADAHMICLSDIPATAISGIIAPNRAGKSTIFDIICYCLFDELPRGDRKSILNSTMSSQHNCFVEFQCEFITAGLPSMQGAASQIKTFRIEKGDTIGHCKTTLYEGDIIVAEDKKCYEYLENIIGGASEFLTSTFIMQGHGKGFSDLDETKRRLILNNMFGLGKFAKYYERAKYDLRAIESKISAAIAITREPVAATSIVGGASTSSTVAELEREIADLTRSISTISARAENARKYMIESFSMISGSGGMAAVTRLNEANLAAADIEILTLMKRECENIAAGFDFALKSALSKATETAKTVQNVRPISYFSSLYSAMNSERARITSDDEIGAIRMQMKTLIGGKRTPLTSSEITAELAKLLDERRKLKFAHNCDACADNRKQFGSTYSREDLEFDKQIVMQVIALKDKISAKTKDTAAFAAATQRLYDEIISRLDTHCAASLSPLLGSNLMQSFEELVAEEKWLATELARLRGILGRAETMRDARIKYDLATTEFAATQTTLKVYKAAMCPKSGIVKNILAKYMEVFCDSINHLLSLFCNFRIGMSAKASIIVLEKTANGEHSYSIDVCSGFQKFAIDMCCRINMSRCLCQSAKFMILDEAITMVDSQNMDQVNVMFSVIKKLFDYIIIVSFSPEVQALIEYPFYICVGGDGSKKIISGWNGQEKPIIVQAIEPPQIKRLANNKWHCEVCAKELNISAKSRHEESAAHKKKAANAAAGIIMAAKK